MTEDQVHLHNEFLLCLFNKVRGLAAATPTRKLDRDKAIKEKRLRLKRKYRTDKSNFEVWNYSQFICLDVNYNLFYILYLARRYVC